MSEDERTDAVIREWLVKAENGLRNASLRDRLPNVR